MRLYLIRHGESYVNLPDWKNGNTDEGLTELGRQQVDALASYLPSELPKIDALYASDMLRTRETAQAVHAIYGCEIHYDARLREVGNNRWDHTPWPNNELPKAYANFWGTERPFEPLVLAEGGESWSHFRLRVSHFLEELILRHYSDGNEQAAIVAVCHGGVIDAAISYAFNVGHQAHCIIWTQNTGITYLEYIAQRYRVAWAVHYHNRTEHLQKLPATQEKPRL